MAHFALLDSDNTVLDLIVIENSVLIDDNGQEKEQLGIAFCQTLKEGRWIQTSFNDSIRKRYAQIGGYYDPDADCFVCKKPYNSWILDSDKNWIPPLPYPNDKQVYEWDESTVSWKKLEIDENAEPITPSQ